MLHKKKKEICGNTAYFTASVYPRHNRFQAHGCEQPQVREAAFSIVAFVDVQDNVDRSSTRQARSVKSSAVAE